MDVEVEYYSDAWHDLTSYLTAYRVQDEGISQVSGGIVNLESARSDFTDFLANPYRLIRIRNNPSSWYPIFFGYVDDCHVRTLPGTIAERSKISLDLMGYEAKLAQDYITYDYYAHQSAISPLADSNAFSYRDVIESFLTLPDSTRDGTGLSSTGFTVTAANAPTGIDGIIDGSCNFHKQSLFEATRTICEHIGYDGYFPKFTNLPFTPTMNLYPYSKASATTLTAPFIEEPQYSYGSLNDVANIAFIWGGVDVGVPSDGDRWTEYGATKYSPAAWTANRASATNTVTDEDKTVFTNAGITANNKCVKFNTTNSTDLNFIVELDITQTDELTVDALSRCSSLIFSLKSYKVGTPTTGYLLSFYLKDSSNNVIAYKSVHDYTLGIAHVWSFGDERQFELSIGTNTSIASSTLDNQWYQFTGSTFDWEHVVSFKVIMNWAQLLGMGNPAVEEHWGMYIDGLQFVGGYEIKPFEWYSETLNPPVQDATSIAAYGMHPIHIQDTTIASFEHAQAEGARVIANMKDPKPILSVKKPLPETTQLYPSNVVTVASTEYRIKNVTYNWKYGNHKTTNVEYQLVGKIASLPPIWTMTNELRFLVK